MGKVDIFSITTDRPEGIYVPGEVVTGLFYIRIAERLKINCLKMTVKGSARVEWSERKGGGKSSHTVYYRSFEEYMNFIIVFLTKQSNDDLYLEYGEHRFPFQFILPANLPTSVEFNFACIRYSLYGTIDIPWAIDKHVEKNITVISLVDLNLNPNLRQPAAVYDSKTLCCCCCKSGPIIAHLSILKGGYVPGESIVFNAKIENKSNKDVKDLRLILIQNIMLHATTKSREWKEEITEIKFGRRITAGSEDEWKSSVLTIPPVCASSNNTCRIICVTYSVRLNVNPQGPSWSFDLDIPIAIGTIPLNMDNLPQPSVPEQEYISFNRDGGINQGLVERMEGETTYMDRDYLPRYPFYRSLSKTEDNRI